MTGSHLSRVLILGLVALTAAPAVMLADASGDRGNESRHEQREQRGESQAEQGQGNEAKPESRESRHERRRQQLWNALFKDIELSGEQTERIKALFKEGYEARRAWLKEHRDELKEIHDAIREARRADDEDAKRAAQKRLGELMKDAPNPAETADKVRKLLDPEQVEQFNRNIDELRKQWHDRHQRDRKEDADNERSKGRDGAEPREDAPEEPDDGEQAPPAPSDG